MDQPSTPSAVLAVGTTVARSKPCTLTAIMLHPGSAASTVTFYDNATAGSGTVLAVLQGPASGATVIIPFDSPVCANNGITAVVSGTGAQAQVYFQPWG
jgi:hypothetical protein